MKFTKMRLGELLINAGVLTEEQLQSALKEQRGTSKLLGQILIDDKYISEVQMIRTVADQLHIEYVDVSMVKIEDDVAKMIPETIAKLKNVVPISLKGKELTVAFSDPLDYSTINDLSIYTRCDIKVVISERSKILNKIHYIHTSQKAFDAAAELRKDNIQETAVALADSPDADIDNQPVIRLVNNMIEQAVLLEASDIHIEPQEKEMVVRFRIDGHLSIYMRTDISILNSVVSRIKFIGGMNIAEKRIPQDGRINYKSGGRDVDLRISLLPTVFGEKVVIRIVTALSFAMEKEGIGFLPENLSKFNSLIHCSHGIVLLTGPTGSGKTTTLYTAIRELNNPNINIVTVENPVEMIIAGITQVEVAANSGMTFGLALRSILRQDPDIVMVGEIRDKETAQIASSVAITGHLVFSTLHTYDSPSAIIRLVDMGIPPYMVSSSLAGVVSQRLMRKVCEKCQQDYIASTEEKELLGVSDDTQLVLKHGAGCEYCGNTGYHGRTAIHEVMPVTYAVKQAIHLSQSVDDIKQIAIGEGMITLEENCKKLVLEGVTTTEEMLKIYSINEH